MWLAQALARCPALLQFLHSTSAATLQSLNAWTVLPHLLRLPWKKASACSFFDDALFGRWFLACLRFRQELFFFQAEDGIRDFCLSRGLGDVYKRQVHAFKDCKVAAEVECRNCNKAGHLAKICARHIFSPLTAEQQRRRHLVAYLIEQGEDSGDDVQEASALAVSRRVSNASPVYRC